MVNLMRKRYNTLLFDLDNTLLDFQKSEEKALKDIIINTGSQDYQMALNLYMKINKLLWCQLENGILTMQYVQQKRFEILYSFFGMKVNGNEIDIQFKKNLINLNYS